MFLSVGMKAALIFVQTVGPFVQGVGISREETGVDDFERIFNVCFQIELGMKRGGESLERGLRALTIFKGTGVEQLFMCVIIDGVELNFLGYLQARAVWQIPQKHGAWIRGLGLGGREKEGENKRNHDAHGNTKVDKKERFLSWACCVWMGREAISKNNRNYISLDWYSGLILGWLCKNPPAWMNAEDFGLGWGDAINCERGQFHPELYSVESLSLWAR